MSITSFYITLTKSIYDKCMFDKNTQITLYSQIITENIFTTLHKIQQIHNNKFTQ